MEIIILAFCVIGAFSLGLWCYQTNISLRLIYDDSSNLRQKIDSFSNMVFYYYYDESNKRIRFPAVEHRKSHLPRKGDIISLHQLWEMNHSLGKEFDGDWEVTNVIYIKYSSPRRGAQNMRSNINTELIEIEVKKIPNRYKCYTNLDALYD